MLPFDEAQANVVASAVLLATEDVALADAHGRVLAEDVTAPFDVPAFDGSTMDGFAVRAGDFVGEGPWTLPIDGETTPGEAPPPLANSSVRRIFTGAPLPQGADTVVMQEEVVFDATNATFTKAPKRGHFVRSRASDLREGAIALARGIRLNSAKIALAASLDRTTLTVARKPRVAFLATGNELRAPGEKGTASSIPDSITLPL
ncbi:MAG TPA: molybdopterin molybdenumtransferase MoeA, partial [Polyangiaceae bacterium]